jgi:hypothetical protein
MELIVFLSDFHYGRKTAGWNPKTARNALHAITQQLLQLREDTDAEAIHLLFLGDIMDGECVYPEQAYELELAGFDQVMDGAMVFFDALIEPLAHVCPITMDGVPGNHAYLRWAHRKTNLDAFFYGVLEQKIKERRLRTVRSAFFQRTRQDALELKLAECGQVRCLIGHGHFLRSPSFPIVAITRRLSAWMTVFRKFQVVAFGHYHRCGLIWIAPETLLVLNGCLLAHDEFSLTRYGSPGDRKWVVLVTDGQRVLTAHFLHAPISPKAPSTERLWLSGNHDGQRRTLGEPSPTKRGKSRGKGRKVGGAS